MNTTLFSFLLAVLLIVVLTHWLVLLTFPDARGYHHCPRHLHLRWFSRWLEWTKPLRKLAGAIHVGLAFLQAPGEQEVIFAPCESWSVLHETLTMDAKSKAFDKELRLQILQALAKITIL